MDHLDIVNGDLAVGDETEAGLTQQSASGQRSQDEKRSTKTAPVRSKTRRRGQAHSEEDDSVKRKCVSTACIACRKRKSKCDGQMPACAACSQVYNTECVYDPNSDHRRKGVYKTDLDNLKTRSSTLHTIIEAILNYREEDVPALVKEIRTCNSLDGVAEKIIAREQGVEIHDEERSELNGGSVPARSHFESMLYSKMGDLRLDNGFVRYIGGTSNLIHMADDSDSSLSIDELEQHDYPILSWTNVTSDPDLIIHLLNMYFTWHYTYFTTLSKSMFYKDFALGKPRSDQRRKNQYCSPLLVNAMLALGCHFTGHPGAREVADDSATAGDHFFREAKRLLLEEDELEKPQLTTVQALALMSVREAGCGREAKGWVYSGMSFRMAQDMGLHLDASQLASDGNVSGDETYDDVRRITFWGCYLFDKCWSNYLGRLPQIPSSIISTPKFDVHIDEEASQWSPYTDSGFTQANEQPARTRAVALEISKLCEISNDILQTFYNPTQGEKAIGKQIELKSLSDLHSRLEAWRRQLAKEFEPKEGGLPSILVMHMFFQLLFIHLFRPFLKYTQATSPLPANISPRKLCTQAAAMISKLLRLYKRSHGLRQICNVAVYIAHSACTIHLLSLPDKHARRDIMHGVKHLEEIAEGWLCARRSLGILSLLASKWKVDLPEEAVEVLDRTTTKFGSFKREVQSPTNSDSHSMHRLSSIASMHPPVQTAVKLISQPQYDSHGFAMPMQINPTRSRIGSASYQARPSSSSSHILQPAIRGETGSPDNAAVRISHTFESNRMQENSPSAMFGGIEQLLRESNDWAYKDQAQYGTGFGNWNGFEATSAAGMSDQQVIDALPAAQAQDGHVLTSSTTPTIGDDPNIIAAQDIAAVGIDAPAYDDFMSYNEDEWYR